MKLKIMGTTSIQLMRASALFFLCQFAAGNFVMTRTQHEWFTVYLKDCAPWHILAEDSEHAAWHALELANAEQTELIDVRYYEEWS